MAHEKGKGEICFHFFCLLNISSGRQHSSSSFFSEMLDVCFDMFFFCSRHTQFHHSEFFSRNFRPILHADFCWLEPHFLIDEDFPSFSVLVRVVWEDLKIFLKIREKISRASHLLFRKKS